MWGVMISFELVNEWTTQQSTKTGRGISLALNPVWDQFTWSLQNIAEQGVNPSCPLLCVGITLKHVKLLDFCWPNPKAGCFETEFSISLSPGFGWQSPDFCVTSKARKCCPSSQTTKQSLLALWMETAKGAAANGWSFLGWKLICCLKKGSPQMAVYFWEGGETRGFWGSRFLHKSTFAATIAGIE